MQTNKTTNVILGVIALALVVLVIFLITNKKSVAPVILEPDNQVQLNQPNNTSSNNQQTPTTPSAQSEMKTYTTADYSFVAPKNLSHTGPKDLMGNGCLWDNLSIGGDGLRMGGEIGIYPKSCFNLANAGCKTEVAEKDGYYIIACYDRSSGTTVAEEIATKAAYQSIVATFDAR